MLNSIGLENPGVQEFLHEILPPLRKYDVPIIVNISGNTVEEYGEEIIGAYRAWNSGFRGSNISCPNVKEGALPLAPNAMMPPLLWKWQNVTQRYPSL